MRRVPLNDLRARWALVNRAERAELRRTSIEQRLERLAALMASVHAVGGANRLRAEDPAVRRRWARLRRAARG